MLAHVRHLSVCLLLSCSANIIYSLIHLVRLLFYRLLRAGGWFPDANHIAGFSCILNALLDYVRVAAQFRKEAALARSIQATTVTEELAITQVKST